MPHSARVCVPVRGCRGWCKLPCGEVNCKVTWTCGRRSDHRGKRAQHGVSDEDILHAYANPIRVFDLDEGFTMVIGVNLAAIIYEIGVVDGVSAAVIVHAMRAREKFLR